MATRHHQNPLECALRHLFAVDGLASLHNILHFDDRIRLTDGEISATHVPWPSSRFIINLPPPLLVGGGALAHCSAVHPTTLYPEYELWIVVMRGVWWFWFVTGCSYTAVLLLSSGKFKLQVRTTTCLKISVGEVKAAGLIHIEDFCRACVWSRMGHKYVSTYRYDVNHPVFFLAHLV
jgi:hypothetical protein